MITKNYNKKPILFRIVPIFIGFVFMLMISIMIFSGFVLYKVGTTIEDEGLKNVLTKIWEGPQK